MRPLAAMAFAGLCVLAALAPACVESGASSRVMAGFPGWPASFEGKPLSPLPSRRSKRVSSRTSLDA